MPNHVGEQPLHNDWVTLESAKFVAANPDTLDDSHEMAVRAHNYAACKFR